ncbi:thiol peroxidase [Corynebacterium alimapuense]|uniref:Thiol peroxidase n=1 Tax=Corynebacterium alimapuense TaxID=1576874 RepID=A0A3M8K7Q6_9CORY|nr:thiol peroxidase [Corynebacterium alimapuense]RNE49253.1 thiol peroxidase [Corynebacterium alimapuense]
MANVTFKQNQTTTVGDLPQVGESLPSFSLVGTDLSEITLADFAGKRVVLNIFPSLDTGVCAQSVREFNSRSASLDNTVVLCVSHDLPFAHGRFCAAEGIENVVSGSAFRSSFGEDFGLTLEGSPLQGLLARSVIIADENGQVTYTELVDEITDSPDVDAAVAALS